MKRPFTDTLAAMRFGELVDDLSTAMHELVDACSNTGKTGTLTLTIKIKPGKAGQMELVDEVKTKLPPPEKGTTLMFVTPEGNLTRTDPRQMLLEGLREVDTATGEIKEVAHG